MTKRTLNRGPILAPAPPVSEMEPHTRRAGTATKRRLSIPATAPPEPETHAEDQPQQHKDKRALRVRDGAVKHDVQTSDRGGATSAAGAQQKPEPALDEHANGAGTDATVASESVKTSEKPRRKSAAGQGGVAPSARKTESPETDQPSKPFEIPLAPASTVTPPPNDLLTGGLHLLSDVILTAAVTEGAEGSASQNKSAGANIFEQSFGKLVPRDASQTNASVEGAANAAEGDGVPVTMSNTNFSDRSGAFASLFRVPSGDGPTLPLPVSQTGAQTPFREFTSYFDLPLASASGGAAAMQAGSTSLFGTNPTNNRVGTGWTPFLFPGGNIGNQNAGTGAAGYQSTGFTPLFYAGGTVGVGAQVNWQASMQASRDAAAATREANATPGLEEQYMAMRSVAESIGKDASGSAGSGVTAPEAAKMLHQQQMLSNEEGASLAHFLFSQGKPMNLTAQAQLWTPTQTPTAFSVTPNDFPPKASLQSNFQSPNQTHHSLASSSLSGLQPAMIESKPPAALFNINFTKHERSKSTPVPGKFKKVSQLTLLGEPVVLRQSSTGSIPAGGPPHFPSIATLQIPNFGTQAHGKGLQVMQVKNEAPLPLPQIPTLPGYQFVHVKSAEAETVQTKHKTTENEVSKDGPTATERAGFSFASIMGLENERQGSGDDQANDNNKRRISWHSSTTLQDDDDGPDLTSDDEYGMPTKKRKKAKRLTLDDVSPPFAEPERRKSGRPKKPIVPHDLLSGMLEHPDFAALEEEEQAKKKSSKSKSKSSKTGGKKQQEQQQHYSGDDTSGKRLERRRERNRTAARRSRERRVKYMEELEQEIGLIRDENARMRQKLAELGEDVELTFPEDAIPMTMMEEEDAGDEDDE